MSSAIVDQNIQRLHERDRAKLEQLWTDGDKDLPDVPSTEVVLNAIHEHARKAIARAMPLLERQAQELLAIKHLDPWDQILNETGIQTHITKALRSSLIDSSSICHAPRESQHDSHDSSPAGGLKLRGVDFFCVSSYILLVVIMTPIICIHFLVKPIPPLGIQYLVLCWFIALCVSAGFHTYVSAGRSVLSKKKSCLVVQSALHGLARVEIALDEKHHRPLKPHLSAEQVGLTWPEIRLEVVVRFFCNDESDQRGKLLCLRLRCMDVKSKILLKIESKVSEYTQLYKENKGEAARQATRIKVEANDDDVVIGSKEVQISTTQNKGGGDFVDFECLETVPLTSEFTNYVKKSLLTTIATEIKASLTNFLRHSLGAS